MMLGVAMLIWLIVASDHRRSLVGAAGAGGMLGGALGNLVDRLPDGSVTDFIALGPWPRFNLADTALPWASVCWLCGKFGRRRLFHHWGKHDRRLAGIRFRRAGREDGSGDFTQLTLHPQVDETNLRLDKFVATHVADLSRGHVQRLIETAS